MSILLNQFVDFAGINVDINIGDGVHYLTGDSGIGKSYLLRVLNELLRGKAVVRYVNYIVSENYRDIEEATEVIESVIKTCDVGLFDNADLYMSRRLHEYIESHCKVAILSMHDLLYADVVGRHFLTVDFDGKTLKVV